MKLNCIFACLTLIASAPAGAQIGIAGDEANLDRDSVADLVMEEAFEPQRFFETLRGTTLSARSALGGPRWALGGSPDCMDGACDWVFRLVEVPGLRDTPRGVSAQSVFVSSVMRSLNNGASLQDAIQRQELLWLETDLSSCSEAGLALEELWQEGWAPSDQNPLNYADRITIQSPVSRIEVEINFFTQRYRYEGLISGGQPGGNALDLYNALRPCMEPSSAPPPWERIED